MSEGIITSIYKNVAAELLAKLLGDEIKVRSKRNLVQSREFSAVTAAQQRPGFRMLKKNSERVSQSRDRNAGIRKKGGSMKAEGGSSLHEVPAVIIIRLDAAEF